MASETCLAYIVFGRCKVCYNGICLEHLVSHGLARQVAPKVARCNSALNVFACAMLCLNYAGGSSESQLPTQLALRIHGVEDNKARELVDLYARIASQ